MYDVERRISLEPMQANWAASQADLWYTEVFRISVVTSVSF